MKLKTLVGISLTAMVVLSFTGCLGHLKHPKIWHPKGPGKSLHLK